MSAAFLKLNNHFMQIIPAINARDFNEARAMLAQAAQFLPEGGWIHIDVADGTMTPNSTWGNAEEFKKLAISGLRVEVHLMVKDWETRAAAWRAAGAERIIVPVELVRVEQCAPDIMVSVGPHASLEALKPFFGIARQFQVLAVLPGLSGQSFREEAYAAIASVRAQAPDAILEVDGGVTPAITGRLREAGANSAVSASYIFKSRDPAQAYQELWTNFTIKN